MTKDKAKKLQKRIEGIYSTIQMNKKLYKQIAQEVNQYYKELLTKKGWSFCGWTNDGRKNEIYKLPKDWNASCILDGGFSFTITRTENQDNFWYRNPIIFHCIMNNL